MHTQLVVLGGGPGGYAAAFLAADQGVEVTLVDANPMLGGTCLLRGCIPSKALLHAARVIREAEELSKDWGVSFAPPTINVDKLREKKQRIVNTLSGGIEQLAKRRKVTRLCAQGRFENSKTLRLEGDDPKLPENGLLTFDHAIIAVGSLPVVPRSMAIDSPRVMTSTGALELPDIPASMLVVGGGYIGLEMATAYAALGTEISIVEMTDSLLPIADGDLVRPLHRILKKSMSDRIYLNTSVKTLEDLGETVRVTFDGPDTIETREYDRVLITTGRRPNTDHLGLETTQVTLDERGFVVHDDSLRTADPHILVIGDAACEPMLAHKASHEAKVAVDTVLGRDSKFAPKAIPAVVFTDPEIAWAGLTALEAKEQDIAVTSAVYPWAANGRSHTLGRTEGMTRWLVDPETRKVLGCGMVGPGVSELIGEGTLAIETGRTIDEVAETIHPHPTTSETLMTAAEVFFGTATEIYKPRRNRG